MPASCCDLVLHLHKSFNILKTIQLSATLLFGKDLFLFNIKISIGLNFLKHLQVENQIKAVAPALMLKQTHRLFPVHGLHPQLPVALRKSLESDGRVSMETETRAIKKQRIKGKGCRLIIQSKGCATLQQLTTVSSFIKLTNPTDFAVAFLLYNSDKVDRVTRRTPSRRKSL